MQPAYIILPLAVELHILHRFRYKHCIVYTGHRSSGCRCIFNWTTSKNQGAKQDEPERQKHSFSYHLIEAGQSEAPIALREDQRRCSPVHFRQTFHLNKAKGPKLRNLEIAFLSLPLVPTTAEDSSHWPEAQRQCQ